MQAEFRLLLEIPRNGHVFDWREYLNGGFIIQDS